MAGRLVLVQEIGVRIPVPEPVASSHLLTVSHWFFNSEGFETRRVSSPSGGRPIRQQANMGNRIPVPEPKEVGNRKIVFFFTK